MSDAHANPVAFVRTEEVPSAPPPSNAAGPTKWIKDNLFASPFNGALTLVAFYLIYLILTSSLPWMMSGIWQAPSLSACREILDGTSGACFAVLT